MEVGTGTEKALAAFVTAVKRRNVLGKLHQTWKRVFHYQILCYEVFNACTQWLKTVGSKSAFKKLMPSVTTCI